MPRQVLEVMSKAKFTGNKEAKELLQPAVVVILLQACQHAV